MVRVDPPATRKDVHAKTLNAQVSEVSMSFEEISQNEGVYLDFGEVHPFIDHHKLI